MRPLPLIALVALVLPLLAGPVRAKEPTKAENLLEALEAARKADDTAGWTNALKTVPTIYAEADEKEQPKLMRALGKALGSDTLSVGQTGLKMMIEIGDADSAWKHGLARAFPDEKAEVAAPLDLDVLRTIYALEPDDAIDPLLHLMKKGRDPVLAASALRVLGTYGDSKRRVEVLEDLVKILIANAPGRGGRKNSGGSDRFKAMATQIESTLNDLTGQDYSIKDWGAVWKEHKKHPEILFVNPLPEDR